MASVLKSALLARCSWQPLVQVQLCAILREREVAAGLTQEYHVSKEVARRVVCSR